LNGALPTRDGTRVAPIGYRDTAARQRIAPLGPTMTTIPRLRTNSRIRAMVAHDGD